MKAIEFYRDFDISYGVPETVDRGINRITARNAKDYTWKGTNTYLIGETELAILDPGPACDSHIEAVIKAIDDRPVVGIFVTHNHDDHSAAAPAFAKAIGAPIYGAAPVPASVAKQTAEDVDQSYKPDHVLADGDRVETAEWCLRARLTPGHFPNHLCYALGEKGTLFSGDHVMGWQTTVISPPLGCLVDYIASLEQLLDEAYARYLPGHGPAITDPDRYVRQLIAHRHARTAQVRDCVERGIEEPAKIVAELYDDLSARLRQAAAQSVRAHLDFLAKRECARQGSDG